MRLRYLVIVALFVTFAVHSPTTFAQWTPPDPTAMELTRQALAVERDKKFEEAIVLLKNALKLEPNNPAILVQFGKLLDRMGEFDGAVSILRKAVAIKPNEAFLHYSLCRALMHADKRIEAPDECKEAIRLDPDRPEYKRQLALITALDKKSVAAIAALEELYRQYQYDLEFIEGLGDVYYGISDFPKAVLYYEKIVSLEPTYARPYFYLASSYDHLDRITEAIATARIYVSLRPKSYLSYGLLGEMLQNGGFYDDSISELKKSVQINPEAGIPHLKLSESYFAIGDKANALKNLRIAYRLLPHDLGITYLLGMRLIEHGDMADAIKPLEEANELKKDDYRLLTNLGLAYFESNDFDKGIIALSKADTLHPGDEMIQMFLRVARARENMVARFQQILESAREKPNDILERRRLAGAFRYKGDLAGAEQEHLALIAAYPKDARLYNDLAIFYGDTGQTEKSVNYLIKTAELSPSPGLFFSIGIGQRTLGRLRDAEASFRKTIDMAPNDAAPLMELADTLTAAGNRDEAFQTLLKAFEIAPSNTKINLKLVWHYLRTGNKDAALRHFGVLRGLLPGNDELRYVRKALRASFHIKVE